MITQKYAVDTKEIEAKLGPKSLAPVKVRGTAILDQNPPKTIR